jgi:hypothetical protein
MSKARKMSVTTASTKGGARAIHADAGDVHAVSLKNIRVFLVPDGESGWYAQALDLDYAAGGNSIEEAKENFSTGLAETIYEYLRYYGNLKKFLRPAPADDWAEYLATPATLLNLYETVTTFELLKNKELGHKFPFESIQFLTKETQRVTA